MSSPSQSQDKTFATPEAKEAVLQQVMTEAITSQHQGYDQGANNLQDQFLNSVFTDHDGRPLSHMEMRMRYG
jgi:hypothetical protein